MFTLRKLESLGRKTRLRKLVLLFQKAEIDLSSEKNLHNRDFFISVFNSENIKNELPGILKGRFTEAASLFLKTENPKTLLRCFNNLRHSLISYLDSEPAEWDLLDLSGNKTDHKRKIMPFEVYIEDIRSPFNVGSIIRTSEAFGVSCIYISENTPSPEHSRAKKTSRGLNDIVAWKRAGLDVLHNKNIFALETGGTLINEFTFPVSGIVLVGSEELGLSPEALKKADNSAGRVSIPMAGVKRSLNVATAFGILMWKWYEQCAL